MDLFDPLYVKHGRGTAKRWCCLFTCLNTRSVHLSWSTLWILTTLWCASEGSAPTRNLERASKSEMDRKSNVSCYSAGANGCSSRQQHPACLASGSEWFEALRRYWRWASDLKQSPTQFCKRCWQKLNGYCMGELLQPIHRNSIG